MDKPPHIVMFPWLAHGHISPYLALATELADNGFHVSFVSTQHNITKLKPLFSNQNNLPGKGKINLIEIPLPTVEGLLPGIENTTDLPTDQMGLLIKATDEMQDPFQSLIQKLCPDFIIYDVLQSWAATEAAKLGIPAIYFITYGAAYYSYDYSPARGETHEITPEDLARPPPEYPSSAISWRLPEATARLALYNYKIGKLTMRDRIMNCYKGCSAIAIKSCQELEGKYIDFLQKTTGKRVLPVGPLLGNILQRPFFGKNTPDLADSSLCLRWLDTQTASSVVYVSFGSEYFLSREEVEELTLGLEASGQPFICVLRFPCNSEKDFHEIQKNRLWALLPDGFGARIENKGIVMAGWAPQREILAHRSTGSFVTHCGWSSILEGMSNGLPLIALPMQLDQAINARLIVEEFKVGVEVGKGKNDRALSREAICKAVRNVMVEGGIGGQLRSKAREMADFFRSRIGNERGSQNRCIQQFIEYLSEVKPI